MAKYEIVDIRSDIRVIDLDTNDLITSIRQIPNDYREGNKRNDYLVSFSAVEWLDFEYNIEDNKLYVYTTNHDKAKEQSDLHIAMEERWESIDWLYTAYLDRFEYRVHHKWELVNKKILSLIS